MAGAGDWKAVETGKRWRLGGAGEWQSLEKFRGQRNLGARESRCWINVGRETYSTFL
jgi:hypothetical protein